MKDQLINLIVYLLTERVEWYHSDLPDRDSVDNIFNELNIDFQLQDDIRDALGERMKQEFNLDLID